MQNQLDARFVELIKDIDECWLADVCDASPATVRVWKSGANLPTETVRRAILEQI
jgi:hypothetical protein